MGTHGGGRFAQPLADVLMSGAQTEVSGDHRADDVPRWQPGAPRGGQTDWQTTAPPSALQRLFRPDLPKTAPNPFGMPTMASAPRFVLVGALVVYACPVLMPAIAC